MAEGNGKAGTGLKMTGYMFIGQFDSKGTC